MTNARILGGTAGRLVADLNDSIRAWVDHLASVGGTRERVTGVVAAITDPYLQCDAETGLA